MNAPARSAVGTLCNGCRDLLGAIAKLDWFENNQARHPSLVTRHSSPVTRHPSLIIRGDEFPVGSML